MLKIHLLLAHIFYSKMLIGFSGDTAAAGCPRQETVLEKIGLIYVLQSYGLFIDGGGKCVRDVKKARGHTLLST